MASLSSFRYISFSLFGQSPLPREARAPAGLGQIKAVANLFQFVLTCFLKVAFILVNLENFLSKKHVVTDLKAMISLK
jgi:hypothetical protein